jgi:hypothetical protein
LFYDVSISLLICKLTENLGMEGSTSTPENPENNVNSTQTAEVKVPASFNFEKEFDRLDKKVLKEALLSFMKSEPSQADKLKEVIYQASLPKARPAITKYSTPVLLF